MNLKSLLSFAVATIALSSFSAVGLRAQMPDLSGVTKSVTGTPETNAEASDALAGILAAIDQGAKAYPEQTSAIAKQLEVMTGGKVPSKDSLTALATAVQSVWSAGKFTTDDAQTMATTLNSVLNSANIPLPAWTGSLTQIQNLLTQNGVTTDKAIQFGTQVKDYVMALAD